MTCDECRSMMVKKHTFSVSRAERAVVFRHLNNCPECVNWLSDVCKGAKLSDEQLLLHHEQSERDHQDQEFLDVVEGPERNP